MASSARLDELKKKFDDNPRRYFAPLANEYRKLGDLVQAIALCRTHLPNQPGHISGNIVLAQALYESRELAESRQAFEAALDLDPENLIALRFLGDIAREEGAPAVAYGWYQRVLEADPRNDEIAQLLKAVEAEEAAARSELASRPTPPHTAVIDEMASQPVVEASAPEPIEDEQVDDATPEFTVPEAEAFVVPSSGSYEATPAVDEATEPLELPSFSDAFEAPAEPAAATFESMDGSSDPFFAQSAMGEFEAVAEPSMDDWFSAEPAAAAAPEHTEAQSLFPDLSAAADLPAPAEAVAEDFSWSSAEAEAPASASEPEPSVPEVRADATPEFVVAADEPVEAAPAFVPAFEDDYSADPESDTIEFTVESVAEPMVVDEEPAVQPDAVEEPVVAEEFAPAPWAFAEESEPTAVIDEPVTEVEPAFEPVAEAAEPVEAPSYDWSAADVPAEPLPAWTEAQTTEMPSAWESALAPEQLTPVSELPVERDMNPLLGRTPRFEQAIPEEPPAPFVTETMAELYLQQGFTEEGLAIYRQLLRQSPNDESLQRRIAALEDGGESNVLESAGSEAPSVRAFFARFATRPRRHSADRAPSPNDSGPHAAFGGVASHDEAMTQPDEPSTLTHVFSERSVSSADAQAAATLASAFGIETASDAGAEGELSLGHLFRDVEARSPGAVTSAGFADTTEEPDTRQASDVESHADIEQFTAWLEGLKKK